MGKTKFRLEDLPLEKRLGITRYNRDDCNAAIRGQKIPRGLGLKVQRFAVIRGIRHHNGFAHELRGVVPEFTRALKDKRAMYNISALFFESADLSLPPNAINYLEDR
ncbi:hypothetical protein PCG10_010184 [Penicillium crustosum]|uniref:Uncharacterized protein n=1 Tax=Penicillium crustosum TaxID=36656 RepID=A0A9P5GSB4_PENCR|nr:uncharacterized protein N7487_009663 [Penicillium crustosum]KAF7528649.1 hypothetical protein PCG10_010184 [Penicillium crustosum]KAJ5395360.1 hypothetical protein N7487_009663 [Penicillium crustosum]